MQSRYIVITPVKDEDRYAEHTLQSMINQTVKPVRWLIVDDGSTDRTPEILENYRKNHDFIEVLQRPRGQSRQPGSAVIRAFERGYEAGRNLDYDFVVKLDCDLSFEPDYFESLLAQFALDPKLGIASGVYLESRNHGPWIEVSMPPYHAAGASKVVRKACFEEIGGFQPTRGWDTIDEIRAVAKGWKTRHFSPLKMKHWKPEGSGIGSLRTNTMHGEIYYLTGGSTFFFVLKVLHRMRFRPYLLGGFLMAWGYFRAMVTGREKLVTKDEARCYRSLLNGRMYDRCRRIFQTS